MTDYCQDDIESIYQAIIAKCVALSTLLQYLNIVEASLTQLEFPKTNDLLDNDQDDENLILRVFAHSVSLSDNLIHELLSDSLKPHFRHPGKKAAPRLIGHIQFDGDKKVMQQTIAHIHELNQLKKDWGNALKETYPTMHARIAYLKHNQMLQGIITRSIHRQVNFTTPDAPLFRSGLSWSDKQKRSRFIQFNDIINIIKDYHHDLTTSELDALMKLAGERISTRDDYQLVHIAPIRVHVVQTLTVLEGNRKVRRPIKAATPVLCFGSHPVRGNALTDYQYQAKHDDGLSKRHDFFPILEAYGVYQRQLTPEEFSKKRTN